MLSAGQRPSALWRVARSTHVDSRTPWAPGSRGISRMPRVGSFHKATTRDGGVPAGPGTLDHAERGERQHRRPRVVGEHAGVAGGPARRQLRPVEQDRQHQRRPDRAEQVGDGVEAGEVLAHDGDDRDPAAELEELDRPAGHLHRLPPAQPRVQCAAEVVLQHLALVERPAMVLVLAVVPPPPAEADAEVHPVAGQAARRAGDARGPRRRACRRRAGRAPPRGRR